MTIEPPNPQPAPPVQHVHLSPIRISFTPQKLTAWAMTWIAFVLAFSLLFAGAVKLTMFLHRIGNYLGW